MRRGIIRLLALTVLIPVLAGCFRSGKPDQFYMLRATETGRHGMATDGPLIGLGPVRIPAYLDRPQIVTAVSAQEYRLSDDHRWAERLDVNIARVSAENLANLIPTERIVMHPWPRDAKPIVQVAINLQRLDVDPSGEAHFEALWTLRQDKDAALNRKFSCRLPASATDYARMVEAGSQCLGRLNREVAHAIRNLEPASATAGIR